MITPSLCSLIRGSSVSSNILCISAGTPGKVAKRTSSSSKSAPIAVPKGLGMSLKPQEEGLLVGRGWWPAAGEAAEHLVYMPPRLGVLDHLPAHRLPKSVFVRVVRRWPKTAGGEHKVRPGGGFRKGGDEASFVIPDGGVAVDHNT